MFPGVAHSYTLRSSYATSYCLQGTMANGNYVHKRAVANNFLLPGTKIRLVGRSFYGLRRFVVSDTGPALRDGHFDIWSPSCGRSIAWGRRSIQYKLGWGPPKSGAPGTRTLKATRRQPYRASNAAPHPAGYAPKRRGPDSNRR